LPQIIDVIITIRLCVIYNFCFLFPYLHCLCFRRLSLPAVTASLREEEREGFIIEEYLVTTLMPLLLQLRAQQTVAHHSLVFL